MRTELEFFEYPKHKPKVTDEYPFADVICFLTNKEHAKQLIYWPSSRYIFTQEESYEEYEPYVTHWAYLPKK